jgi:hypothetical protein
MVGYVHINKTGGTTIKFILRNSTWLRHCDLQPPHPDTAADGRDIAFARKVFFFGLNSIAGHAVRPWVENLPESIDFFTMLRDPLQRCLSHYQHVKRARRKKGLDITFEEFMQNERYNDRQVRHIAGAPNVKKAKAILKSKFFFVGLLESFDESMHILQKLMPYPITLQYKPRHVAKDNTAKQEVLDNPSCRDLLHRGNQLDLELYAFVRDELYPAFREKAGIASNEEHEKTVRLSGYPLRYKVTRFYNQGIYRMLNKLRRRLQST